MQPASIIDVFEEGADIGSSLVDRRISFAVHFFLLQSAHEALGLGVVIRVAGAAHADQDATLRQLFAIVGAGILHAPVRVMDEAWLGVSGDQGHVERLDGQARLEMVGERPADHLARKSVENDGEINKLLRQPDIGDVGDPNLIEPCGNKSAREIGNDRELVAAVGRVGNEWLLPQAQQIVLAHEAQDVLVIDLQAMDAPEVAADPPIAIEAIVERDRLNFVAQIRLRSLWRANLAKAIEAGARHAAELTQMLDRGGALRLLRVHFFNDRVDGVARDDRSRASMSRKASRKKRGPSAACRSCARARQSAPGLAPVRSAEPAEPAQRPDWREPRPAYVRASGSARM